MTFFESSSRSIFLFKHDLRANAFRVCREGKPVPTFPDRALEPHPEEHREKRCVSKDEAPYWNALVSTFRRLRRDSAALHCHRRGLLLPGRVCDMDRRERRPLDILAVAFVRAKVAVLPGDPAARQRDDRDARAGKAL